MYRQWPSLVRCTVLQGQRGRGHDVLAGGNRLAQFRELQRCVTERGGQPISGGPQSPSAWPWPLPEEGRLGDLLPRRRPPTGLTQQGSVPRSVAHSPHDHLVRRAVAHARSLESCSSTDAKLNNEVPGGLRPRRSAGRIWQGSARGGQARLPQAAVTRGWAFACSGEAWPTPGRTAVPGAQDTRLGPRHPSIPKRADPRDRRENAQLDDPSHFQYM